MQNKREIGPFRASRENFVPEVGPCGSCWESFVPNRPGAVVVGRIMSCSGAAHGCCGRALCALGVLHAGGDGGFALHEAFLRRVAGVSDPRVVQFPPIGDGEAAT